MTSSSLEIAIDSCFKALSASPAGLFSDFDGTLSPVAPTPAEAFLASGAAGALEGLTPLVDTIAIVTGRAAADAREKVPIPGIRYVGNHGLEEIVDGVQTSQPEARKQVAAIDAAMRSIEASIDELGIRDGLVLENKDYSGSVHYRLASDQDAAFRALLPLADEQAARHDLVVTHGKLVIELRPKLEINKGTAVARLIEMRGLRGAVMLGDDVTDVDAFLAIRKARLRGVEGVAVGVVSADTHPSVIESADVCLADVGESVVLLEALGERLSHLPR